LLQSEFIFVSLSRHQELAVKQKPPDHQVGGLPLFRRRFLFSELSRRTSAGTFVPAQGTVALHCSVARLVFGVIPDVGKNRIVIAATAQQKLFPVSEIFDGSKRESREYQLRHLISAVRA
jgi:hypothetical protein